LQHSCKLQSLIYEAKKNIVKINGCLLEKYILSEDIEKRLKI